MSRKSLLLIAAAVISIPAIAPSNAFAGRCVCAISTPHVSTLGASRVAVPQAKFRKNALGSVDANTPAAGRSAAQIKAFLAQRKAAADAAKTSNPSPIQKALDVARAQQKAAEDAAKTSNPSPIQKALDAARAAEKAALE